jgi:hypothetical protein
MRQANFLGGGGVEEHNNRPGWGIRFLWRARSGKVPVESPDQVHGEPGRGACTRRPSLVEVG